MVSPPTSWMSLVSVKARFSECVDRDLKMLRTEPNKRSELLGLGWDCVGYLGNSAYIA